MATPEKMLELRNVSMAFGGLNVVSELDLYVTKARS